MGSGGGLGDCKVCSSGTSKYQFSGRFWSIYRWEAILTPLCIIGLIPIHSPLIPNLYGLIEVFQIFSFVMKTSHENTWIEQPTGVFKGFTVNIMVKWVLGGV